MSTSPFPSLEQPGGYREALRLALPLVISTGSFTVMQFVDRIFLTRYSADAIQAALPAGLLAFTLICVFSGVASFVNTFVAQYHGAGDPRGAARATAQALIFALLAWPLMLTLLPVGEWILCHCGHAPGVLHEELIFYRILMLGSVAVPLGAAISGFFTGRGDTRTNMIAVVIGNLANILLDWLLIFGNWGFPRMGIAGAGWATVLSSLLTPALLLAVYFSPRLRHAYDTVRTFRFDAAQMLRLLRFGFPAAMHLWLDVGSFALFLLLTARLDAVSLAASNIAFSINNLAFMPLVGLGIAASILVGQYQGRGQSLIAARAGWTTLKIGWIYMGIIALTFLIFPREYFVLFTGHGGDVKFDEVLPVGRWMLVMMAVWGLADAANVILAGALRGAGDTRFVMLYSFVIMWVVWLGGEALLLLALGGGIRSAWVWLVVYVFILVIGFAWRFRSGRWQRIDLIGRNIPA